MGMLRRLTGLALVLALAGCKSPGSPEATLSDSGISVSAPRDQQATAFCWSYALVAHIEQRYYELTRGTDRGGFRLDLSEEYLGLIHLANQLTQGKPVDEGRKLSETLALIDQYGLVPEKVGEHTLFRAAFDMPLARDVTDRANEDWAKLKVAENSPLPPALALNVVADVAQLSDGQRAFLSAALGITDASGARFRFGNRDYTPQTFVKERLKFQASDYQVLTFPDSGRGPDGKAAFSAEYLKTLGLVQRAMLYGYSVPISLNFVTESVAENGGIRCARPHCSDAEIGTSTPDWPHSNHAVLLIDYRTAGGGFTPVTADTLGVSAKTVPAEWVIKNSWGFNYNTSADKDLLKRFPLPAYTTMTQEFFEAGHWLRPGRFEAIVPKNVCLRELTKERKLTCAPLDAELDPSLIIGNLNKAALARDPVEFDERAPELTDDTLLQVKLDVTAETLCAELQVAPAVKYVAVFLTPDGAPTERIPRAVLSSGSNWRHCRQVAEGPKTFGLVFEPLNERFKILGQAKRTVAVP